MKIIEINVLRTGTAKKNSHRRLPIKRHSNSNSEEHTFEFDTFADYFVLPLLTNENLQKVAVLETSLVIAIVLVLVLTFSPAVVICE